MTAATAEALLVLLMSATTIITVGAYLHSRSDAAARLALLDKMVADFVAQNIDRDPFDLPQEVANAPEALVVLRIYENGLDVTDLVSHFEAHFHDGNPQMVRWIVPVAGDIARVAMAGPEQLRME